MLLIIINCRWSLIAGRLPGRTDNEVKNYWNTHLNKKSVLGKRKTSDSNKQEIEIDNNMEKQPAKQSHQPILSTSSPKDDDDDGLDIIEKKQVKEESTTSFTDRTWMERTVECFNYDRSFGAIEGVNVVVEFGVRTKLRKKRKFKSN